MRKFNYLFFLILMGTCISVHAQYGKQKKADKLYEDLAYLEAADVYKELIENNYNTNYNKKKLGDTYIMLRNPFGAVKYYEDVVNEDDISPEYYFKYAQALRGTKQYAESRKWLEKYLESGAGSTEIESFLENKDYEVETNYRLSKTDFNSEVSDFGVFEKDNILYFVSARSQGIDEKDRMYSWNGEPYLDIYQLDSDNQVSMVSGDINTKLHDGPAVISPDGKTMYFNRNNYIHNKEGKRDKKAINHLKIYKASLSGNEWKNVVELPFNSNDYSVGHPALSPDGKTMYFTSDMPGGIGGTDIYKIEIKEDGSFGEPVNMGNRVNTKQDENFPFIDKENVLYFSSNGHPGLGLFDIFKISTNRLNEEPQNLGEPINSHLDDFAYFKSSKTNTGFISSNRAGASDNIYSFKELEPLLLKGKVTDIVNNRPISNATVRIFDEDNNQTAFLETDEEGNYETKIKRNKTLPLEAKQIEYEVKNAVVSSFDTDDVDELNFDIQLQPIKDVEYLAEIDNIYFDFDKHTIRPDAATELDKLVELMQNEYPDLVIEIGSHTDLRGSEAYNEELAKRRAQATFDYLVAQGIDHNRIKTYKGFGERNPIVECDNCDEKQHQLNRRSMFSVVKME